MKAGRAGNAGATGFAPANHPVTPLRRVSGFHECALSSTDLREKVNAHLSAV